MAELPYIVGRSSRSKARIKHLGAGRSAEEASERRRRRSATAEGSRHI
uniref:Uncharacterized protein n=1 Tax=Arundo donax TaxID=35708 RepID=A0A0A9HLK5_ARUDO